MGNILAFFASIIERRNVEIEYVIIDTRMSEQHEIPPVASNHYGPASNLAPIRKGPQPSANMFAAQLAVAENIGKSKLGQRKSKLGQRKSKLGQRKSKLGQSFSQIFLQYHKACVQVICTTTERDEIKGSGILFKVSETRLILVTAAHLILNNNLKLVIECKYQQLPSEQVRADKVTVYNENITIPDIYRINGEDLAVIFLSVAASNDVLRKVNKFPRPSRAFTQSNCDTFMCIHHVGGIYKHVSVGSIGSGPGNSLQLMPQLYIAGGPGASGAPLFNIEGDVVGILRGRETDQTRDFMPIEDIFREDNYIHYRGRCDEIYQMYICERNEGLESKSLLCKELKENVSGKGVAELKSMLAEKNIPLDPIVFRCLGEGGAHKETSSWSLLSIVESDHFPAVDAYIRARELIKKQNQPKLPAKSIPKVLRAKLDAASKLWPGGELPAITIPRVIHKKLDTTGGSNRSKKFRAAQAQNIASGNTCEAISSNFDDYRKKGLFRRCNYHCSDSKFKELLDNYTEGFEIALQVHKGLGFITEKERKALVGHIKRSIKDGNCGETLDENKRIAIG